MTLVYHGTKMSNALEIAEEGAILSNLECSIKNLKRRFSHPSRNFGRQFPGKTMRDVAFKLASCGYTEREHRARVECLSITKDFDLAKCYAMGGENIDGGLVLGIDLSDDYINRLEPSFDSAVKFVEGKLGIDQLKEIYLSPVANSKHKGKIKEVFQKYNPNYFLLQ